MNEFVEYYTKYKISPVSQDISDLDLHIKRRLRLYSALGISGALFRGSKILEAGAGSGYNTLVFLSLGAQVDIVEPNETGRLKMQELFSEYGIDERLYKIHACCIEDFKSNVEYDFIIAEGFLPAFNSEYRKKVARGLLEHLGERSILVTTTICEFSYFFEYLRILLSFVLQESYKVSKFDDLVDIFCIAFKSHLDSLTHASRPIEEWVKDTLPNPTTEHFSYSLKDCIVELSEIYSTLCGGGGNICTISTSPCLVPNLSWYKDMDYSYKDTIKNEFYRKRHILLCHKFKDGIRDEKLNIELENDILEFRDKLLEYRNTRNNNVLEFIIKKLENIESKNKDLGEFFSQALSECVNILKKKNITKEEIRDMQYFSHAWGRGQQYISFCRDDFKV